MEIISIQTDHGDIRAVFNDGNIMIHMEHTLDGNFTVDMFEHVCYALLEFPNVETGYVLDVDVYTHPWGLIDPLYNSVDDDSARTIHITVLNKTITNEE